MKTKHETNPQKTWLFEKIWLACMATLWFLFGGGGVFCATWIYKHTVAITEYFFIATMLTLLLLRLRHAILKQKWTLWISRIAMLVCLGHPYLFVNSAIHYATTHFFRGNEAIDRALYLQILLLCLALPSEIVYWRKRRHKK